MTLGGMGRSWTKVGDLTDVYWDYPKQLTMLFISIAFVTLASIVAGRSKMLDMKIPETLPAGSMGCDQGNVTSLKSWQQVLIADSATTSVYGRLCFDTTQGRSNRNAQSLWILGMKSLANFQYDLSRAVFLELTTSHPSFVFGYWGAALSLNQLLWNTGESLLTARQVGWGGGVTVE